MSILLFVPSSNTYVFLSERGNTTSPGRAGSFGSCLLGAIIVSSSSSIVVASIHAAGLTPTTHTCDAVSSDGGLWIGFGFWFGLYTSAAAMRPLFSLLTWEWPSAGEINTASLLLLTSSSWSAITSFDP
jgi:hypothetical protein